MENKFIRVDEVADELGVSRPYAYKLIRQLNEELKGKGFITIAGRVNRQYFNERLYGAGKEVNRYLRTKSGAHGTSWRGIGTGQGSVSRNASGAFPPSERPRSGSAAFKCRPPPTWI